MILTLSDNGKQVTVTGLLEFGTPIKLEITKGYNTSNFIQIDYSGTDSVIIDHNTAEIEVFFDSNNIWIDDIYLLKASYVTSVQSNYFLADFNTKKKIYTIIGKIPYDVKFGYQFDKNAEYGCYAELLYKALKIAQEIMLWERVSYIMQSISKLNTNYTYR